VVILPPTLSAGKKEEWTNVEGKEEKEGGGKDDLEPLKVC